LFEDEDIRQFEKLGKRQNNGMDKGRKGKMMNGKKG
jgi:hypothetical protein